jgi:hypothetical protein
LLLFVLFYVSLVCKCILYSCHRVTTQLQLTNISYHIISRCNQGFEGLLGQFNLWSFGYGIICGKWIPHAAPTTRLTLRNKDPAPCN